MTPADVRQQLAIDLALTADWRRRKAHQSPDDLRNTEAAALLDKLAVSVSPIDDEMIDCCASFWDGAREAELWSEMKRQVGFHLWPGAGKVLTRSSIFKATWIKPSCRARR
jgi:hypothetical protein